jgi:predicted 3-demethylubiquinone-9 3-methyltransferase (glyoxalase superfamily)
MPQITTFLMYVDQAEQAAELYTSIFKNSRIISKTPGASGDQVMSVTFELEGQQYFAFNGGEHFQFSDAISLFVSCEDQAQVDEYWDKLIADGGAASQCGWLKDKFGVSWQIIPKRLGELLQDPDRAKASRVMAAMLKMGKIDVAELEQAAQ